MLSFFSPIKTNRVLEFFIPFNFVIFKEGNEIELQCLTKIKEYEEVTREPYHKKDNESLSIDTQEMEYCDKND